MPTVINCRTLGPVAITARETGEVPDLKGQKNRALLLYLACSSNRSRSREHLVGLLWAEKPEEKARHSLREAIRILRHVLGEDAITTEGDQICLAPGSVVLDTDEFSKLEEAGDWAAASGLVAGQYLEGFSVRGAWAFDEWLETKRVNWHSRSISALCNHCEQLLANGKTSEAVTVALRAHSLDTGSGVAARAVMKSLALAGDRAKALAHYNAYLTRLKEVGAEPDADAVTLAEQVQLERSWHLPDSVPIGVDKGAESRRSPLVGRAKELSRLVAAWNECKRENRAATAFIEGDSGTGKTRLAEELVARARLSGTTVATLRAVEGDLDQPGTGILGLARGGLLDGPGLAAASPRALAAFANVIPEWRDRFGTRGEESQSLDKAIAEVLRVLSAEQASLVLVDDAQWSDRDTLLALTACVRDLASSPLFVCFSLAPLPERDELDELRSRVGREVEGVTVHLDRLEEPALLELAKWAMPGYSEEQVARLARRVASDSAGLPLLAVELLHAVALGLDLEATRGVWPQPQKTLSQTLPGELPDAIVGAIRVGFRRLSAPAQKVLAAAATLGLRTTPEQLGRCTKLKGEDLDTALDELEWQRWLTADAQGYSFVARIVRAVVERDMVTPGQKQRFRDAAQQ